MEYTIHKQAPDNLSRYAEKEAFWHEGEKVVLA